MLSPIAQAASVHGEWVTLKSPPAPTPYDPSSLSDWVPAADGSLRIRGFESDKETLSDIPAAAMAAFTFPATCPPPGLVPMASKLAWGDITYSVLEMRTRRFRGRIDGYTLFLGK